MSLRSIINSTIEQVAHEQSMPLAPLTDKLALDESGLDSLCWAVVFSRLEASIGFDPLAEGSSFPATIGDLVALYDQTSHQQHAAQAN